MGRLHGFNVHSLFCMVLCSAAESPSSGLCGVPSFQWMVDKCSGGRTDWTPWTTRYVGCKMWTQATATCDCCLCACYTV